MNLTVFHNGGPRIGLVLTVVIAWLVFPAAAASSSPAGEETLLLAFPGAEGFGACTPGGRGGKVYAVTTLEDYLQGKEDPIPGSLRAAINAHGPRIIVFRVSGTIELKGTLFISNPYLTIAGQTAPGDGICLRNYRVRLATNDVIIRHMRFRLGDPAKLEQITVSVIGGNNFIMDHCSVTWAVDENLTSYGTCNNITVQWCIISEGLSRTFHPKGEHSKGSILGGDGGMTFHHDIYAHNSSRNPRVNNILLDFRNNIIYDWGYRCLYTRSGPCALNYVNNYIKAGPSTQKITVGGILDPGDDMARMYVSGNVLAGQDEPTRDNRLLLLPQDPNLAEGYRKTVLVAQPFPAPPVRTDSAQEGMERTLVECGATLPKRDSADTRLMEEIRGGTGKIIDSQDDVGGWPVLQSAPAPLDSDNDGMPDEWETAHKLNPADPNDGNGDADGDGYTNIEEYLNGTDPQTSEPNCRVNAAEFHKLQEGAIARSLQGAKDEVARAAEAKARQDARKEAIEKSLKVAIEPDEGPDVKKIIVKLNGKADMEMELIPAGSFLMGSPESEGGMDKERPQHKVNISHAFYMAATPVTYAQFRVVYGDMGKGMDPNLPVAANWFQGKEFCEILSKVSGRSFRLPTEAEWEYACRAGTTTAFNTGDTITTEAANFNGMEASRFNPVGVNRGQAMPVRMFPPNAWGLYDMHGNESEYCLDSAFRQYSDQEVTDPVNLADDESNKVMRGGKASSKAAFIRSAYRYSYAPGIEYSFRPIMELKP